MSTPKDEGFYMPAEWHLHVACWMAWPSHEGAYSLAPLGASAAFDNAKTSYAEVARAIARFEPVHMLVNEEDFEDAQRRCGPSVKLRIAELDDGWLRDTGPSFLIDDAGRSAGVSWTFNGYGNKYPHEKDALLARTILEQEGYECFPCDLVQEGGGIHVDGDGTVLVTENCQLNENRNPNLSKAEVEQYLIDYLNVSNVIWLNGHIKNDETDGHVDGQACFLRPGVVLASAALDPNHPDYEVLGENLEILRRSTDAHGKPLEIIEIDMPVKALEDGTMVSAYYVNFYMANGGIILPAFGFPGADQQARELFIREFPDHEVVQLSTGVISFGGGNIHCITQQQPRAVKNPDGG